MTADELLALRKRLHLFWPVLGSYLRTNPRTLENCEQGQAQRSGRAADPFGREVSRHG
ncbi:MAG: hypothetical protein U1E79_13720 [Ottowia sp.]